MPSTLGLALARVLGQQGIGHRLATCIPFHLVSIYIYISFSIIPSLSNFLSLRFTDFSMLFYFFSFDLSLSLSRSLLFPSFFSLCFSDFSIYGSISSPSISTIFLSLSISCLYYSLPFSFFVSSISLYMILSFIPALLFLFLRLHLSFSLSIYLSRSL